jgi:excisionase family DNA binding protein
MDSARPPKKSPNGRCPWQGRDKAKRPQQPLAAQCDVGSSEAARPCKLLYALPDAAWLLGDVSTRTVVRMVKRGELTAVHVGRRILIPARIIEAWLQKQCAEPPEENTGEAAASDIGEASPPSAAGCQDPGRD